MKNLIAILTLASMVVLGGCKRGEEDPSISFKSRDSRLAGTWTLSSGSITTSSTYKNQPPQSTASNTTIKKNVYSLNGSTASYKYTETLNGDLQDEVAYSLPFKITMTFDKAGTYLSSFEGELVTSGGNNKVATTKSSGLWNWMDQGKSKSSITIIPGASTTDQGASALDAGAFITGNFQLKKLNGTEMTLVRTINYEHVDATNVSVETFTDSETTEFVMTKEE